MERLEGDQWIRSKRCRRGAPHEGSDPPNHLNHLNHLNHPPAFPVPAQAATPRRYWSRSGWSYLSWVCLLAITHTHTSARRRAAPPSRGQPCDCQVPLQPHAVTPRTTGTLKKQQKKQFSSIHQSPSITHTHACTTASAPPAPLTLPLPPPHAAASPSRLSSN